MGSELAKHACVLAVLLAAASTAWLAFASEPAPGAPYTVKGGTQVDARTYAAWQALRQFDCARCHGADYQGSVGPSLIESVRARSQGDFLRIILDGSSRGMPPYRGIARIQDNLDGIYGYFRGRADGAIRSGTLKALENP